MKRLIAATLTLVTLTACGNADDPKDPDSWYIFRDPVTEHPLRCFSPAEQGSSYVAYACYTPTEAQLRQIAEADGLYIP